MEHSTHFYLVFIISLIGVGGIAGLIAGLLGIGGGLVLVPVLYYLFSHLGVDPAVCMHLSIGTSLATIIVTSIASASSHYKQKEVDLTLIKSWAVWLVLGAVLSMSLFGSFKSLALTLFFALMTFSIAMYMLFGPSNDKNADSSGHLPTGPKRWVYGVVVAAASSLMGIGGGSLTVPLLSYYNYPMRQAVGTSAAVGLLIAIPGTAGAILSGLGQQALPPFSLGYVNWLAFIILIPMTSFFAPIGAHLASTLNATYLRYAFVLFLLINAATMLIKAI